MRYRQADLALRRAGAIQLGRQISPSGESIPLRSTRVFDDLLHASHALYRRASFKTAASAGGALPVGGGVNQFIEPSAFGQIELDVLSRTAE